MNLDIITVLAILVIAVILFITGRVREDVVALLVLVSLVLTGLLTPEEALSGFSNTAVVTVWAVLILSAALSRTGVAGMLGRRVLGLAGSSEVRLLWVIMLTVGLLSGFMNSIGVASLFLPVVIDIARRTKIPPSRLLMPLSFAALLGGLITLIGTPPNILVSEVLRQAGLRPFGMFDFTPVGVVVMLVGIAFLVLVGRRLLPVRDIARELSGADRKKYKELYELHERMVIINLPAGSPLVGKMLSDSRLGSALGLNVLAIIRNKNTQLAPKAQTVLQAGDKLLVEGKLERLVELHGRQHLVLEDENLAVEQLVSAEIDVVEVQVGPGSSLIGKTLSQVGFRYRFGVIVLAIRRDDHVLRTNLENDPLYAGDVLLVQGRREQIDHLREENTLLVSKPESMDIYHLEERLMMLRVPPGSLLAGKTLLTSHLGDAFGLGVMGIVRQGETLLMPDPQEPLLEGDTLLVKGKRDDLVTVDGLQELEIEMQPPPDLAELESEEVGVVEAVLSPYTTLVGKTLRELYFRNKYGLTVLAIWHEGRAYRSNLRDMALQFGDALLLYGPRENIRVLGSDPDFLVLTEEAQEAPRSDKAIISLLVIAGVLIPAILGWVNIAIAAIAGVILMVLTGCLTMEEAYRSIQLKAVFLIAGVLPLGIALQQTGAASLIAEQMVALVGGFGPLAVLAGLFILAAIASQVMPNPAVAVLLAPIALTIAADMGVSPYPFVMAVAISASAAFLSPVGHPANILVMGPGGYRFSDYTKVGLPLTLVVLAVAMIFIPLFWPL